jgi:hypothetical protein
MTRQRWLARVALALLALVAEIVGRSLAHRIDVGRHVGPVSYRHADYYPFLLAGVKVAVALMLARVAWRFVKARAVARTAGRLLAAQGFATRHHRPRVRIELSPRLWLGSFLVTSLIYLVQVDAEGISAGRWPLLAPWLHTAALPVFAVLSVAVALIYRSVENWLSDYETYARETVARASRSVGVPLLIPHPTLGELVAPRSLFGLAFESRPPPAPA